MKESTIILLVVENYFVVYLFMTKSFVMVKFLFFFKKRKKEETFTRLNWHTNILMIENLSQEGMSEKIFGKSAWEQSSVEEKE